MRSHTRVIREATLDLAAWLHVAPETVTTWKHRDSIPCAYWRFLADRRIATLDELATWAAFKAFDPARHDNRRRPAA
jgi:hypothetical protein